MLSRFKEMLDSLVENLNNQVWYQQIKAKWEELDPKSKAYLRLASVGIALLLVVMAIMSSIWSVHQLKNELADKRGLLSSIQAANEEIDQLKEQLPAQPGVGKADKDSGPWAAYLESVANTLGLDKSSFTILSEKAGVSGEQAKESHFEIALRHVNLKQIVRYAFTLESGSRPTKLRNLIIETKLDASGYLDATLSLSAYTWVVPK